MGLTLQAYTPDTCCLCGGTDNLTGEHKIKAAALKAEFGGEKLTIGTFDEPDSRMRYAQSTRSKAFHFQARVCRECNSRRSQPADKEFDRFHAAARALLESGKDPALVFADQRYAVGSEAYLNVFRYFAKLLCCHMAELGAPRRVHVARFALGQAHENCVWLAVDRDWTYRQLSDEFGPHQYAAHGGLVVYGDKKTGNANAFHSTVSLGQLRYVFFSRLNWLEKIELKWAHPQFYQWCRTMVSEALDHPMSASERLALGIDAEEA